MQEGYQLQFYTTASRMHHGTPVARWLMELARELGAPGATLLAGAEGFGHDDRMHASHFFELADEPQIVSMALPADRAETLLQRIGQEGLHVFYTRAAIAWAMT
ncbi:DUF190 domain-containing protein [Brachymonas sp. M4Q-1]|uniref:DUF190 domain-containing protein n=1 Tax=Brachymonas sp. M4Q-1 TaxID=3416906 RepID=UPI003CF5EF56